MDDGSKNKGSSEQKQAYRKALVKELSKLRDEQMGETISMETFLRTALKGIDRDDGLYIDAQKIQSVIASYKTQCDEALLNSSMTEADLEEAICFFKSDAGQRYSKVRKQIADTAQDIGGSTLHDLGAAYVHSMCGDVARMIVMLVRGLRPDLEDTTILTIAQRILRSKYLRISAKDITPQQKADTLDAIRGIIELTGAASRGQTTSKPTINPTAATATVEIFDKPKSAGRDDKQHEWPEDWAEEILD